MRSLPGVAFAVNYSKPAETHPKVTETAARRSNTSFMTATRRQAKKYDLHADRFNNSRASIGRPGAADSKGLCDVSASNSPFYVVERIKYQIRKKTELSI